MFTLGSELRKLFISIEIVLVNISMVLVSVFSSHSVFIDKYDILIFFFTQNISLLISFYFFWRNKVYRLDRLYNWVKNLTFLWLRFVVMSVFLVFVFQTNELWVKSFLLETYVLFYAALLSSHILIYLYFKNGKPLKNKNKGVLIVSKSNTYSKISETILSNPLLNYNIVNHLNIEDDDHTIISNEALTEALKLKNIQTVFIELSNSNLQSRIREIIKLCNFSGVRLFFIPRNLKWYRSATVTSFEGYEFVNPQRIPLDSSELRILKRVFDVVFSIVVIVFILLWLTPLLALLIRLESKGPVFFIQERTGINNKNFKCIKFRSMVVNNDADTKQATKNDNRLTRIGAFMRKTNIDELPQFFNVLLGDMSVVGPRPHMLKHTDIYSSLVEHYLYRHFVKPGLTGWAQVNGYRGETDQLWKMEKRVEHDIEYIEHWSFWLDIKIVIMTVFGKSSFYNAF
jgi:Undecaprenyl-phosphate glucose phosphotransferase